MKKGLLVIAGLLVGMSVWGQSYTYDFGTGTGTANNTNAGSGLTTFFTGTPSGGGTYRVRVGTGGGSVVLANPGSSLGTGTESVLTASTGASTNKFTVYGITGASSSLYLKFKIRIDATNTGALIIAAGNGNTIFNDNNSYTNGYNVSLPMIQLSFNSSGVLTVNRRISGSFTPIASSGLAKQTDHTIEIFANNASTSANYSKSGSNTLTTKTWDLWVDGTKVNGTNFATAGTLAAGTNLDAFGFFGESSATNNAQLILDDLYYSTVLPSTPTVNLSADLNAGSEAGTTVVTLTATASSAVSGPQTIDVAVTGTGITAGDYTLGASSITIADGATTGTTTFTVVDDAAIEGSETATVTISNPSSGLVLGSTLSQNIVITDNDANNVNLSADVNSGTEAGTTVVTLTATASTAVTGDQTVDVAVSGTGITAGDYSLSAATFTILDGATTGTVTFTIVDDAAIEGAETATVTISNPSSGIALGSTLSQNIAITDNDFATTVQFSSASASVSEGVGTTTLTLSIANPSASTATTVDVALTGGTGTAADINTYTTQTVTFPANTSGDQTVTLTVTDDALVESAETLIFTLQNVAGGNSAALGSQTTHTLTITDNDFNAVTLNTANVAVSQNFNSLANSGTSSTLPTGWLLSETGSNANTTYTAGTGSGNGGDTYSFGTTAGDRAFGGLRSGSLIPVIGATVKNNTGSTISSVRISYIGEQWRLGVTGRTDQLDFQYSTDASSLSTGTWTDVNALDFVAPVTSGTAGALDGNTAPNRTSKTFDLTGLSIGSGSSFYIRWTDYAASGANDGLAIDDFSIIANPTPEVNFSVTANSGSEAAGTVITLTATASSSVTGAQTVDVAVTGTGLTGTDYSLSSTSITIADGATTGTATFTILDDSDIEGAETAVITISNPSSGITLGSTVSQNVAITDNDFATAVQFSSATSSVAESGGTIDLTFSIANPSASVATTFDVVLTGGTGSAADINAYSTQQVTFPAGSSTNQTLTLTVTDDAVMEGNETLIFSIQNVSGGASATLGAQTTHTLTINDDDNASITLSGSASEAAEDASVITVNLTNDTFEPSLTTGNWTVTNLPVGVTKGALNRVSDTQATITLSGNRTTDYDTNFSPIVTLDHAELVSTASGSVTVNTGFTFTATDDAESITVAGDGSITEGTEAGEILTVTVVGGTISSTFSQAAWTVNNLPTGLSKGTVTLVDATHVTIAITGTASDYDTNANVTVSVSQDQIDDYSGSDLTSTNNVVFTAVVEAVPAGFFSEYIEGSSNNKALEIYNNSGSAIDLAAGNYKVEIYFNGGLTPGTPINLTGTIPAYDVFVLANTSSVAGILSKADQTSGSLTFNGDDAIVLKAGTEVLDVIGQIGVDPGTEWGTGLLSTADNTLQRKPTVNFGDSNGSNVFDPSVEWDGFATDTFTDLGLPPSQPNPTSGSYSNVTVTGNTTLTGNLTVSGTLTISGASLNTGSNSINLGTTGSISGETTTNYIIGTVTANPTLSGSSPVGIAGLGLTINPNSNNLGSTVVTRRTGAAASALGLGLNRRWTITPTTQPSGAVNVTLTWPSADDNGLTLSDLYIYKSEDNGTTWQIHAGPLSTASDPRSLSFTTTSFSDWTIGDGDSPLPIELLSWSATPGNGKVSLNWETASELKHAGFEVLRSTKEKTDFRLVASYTTSTGLRSKGETGGKYSLTDGQVVNGVTYFYKLVDVSVDGKRTEHKVLSVIPTDGKPQQPGYEAPIEFKISSIYPNPFNPTTNLVFDLPKDGLVSIRLYNVIGQEVKVIRNEIMKKGRENLVTITTDNMPTGVYMVMVEFGGQRLTKKLTFLK